MTSQLFSQSYGKSMVRVTKVSRHAERHDLRELTINVALEGDFEATYLTGDNRQVVATDSMKNTIYALAADHDVSSPEAFSLILANHFLTKYAHVSQVTVAATEIPWERIPTAGGPHRHSFVRNSIEQRTSYVRKSRTADQPLLIQAGLNGLGLLKTTDSAFKDFLRDEFTTLADADDRIFATLLEATWTYQPEVGDPAQAFHFDDTFVRLRAALINVFADHYSLSVQQTLYEMGLQALEVCPQVTSIELAMPNQHRIPVNLSPLGRENRMEVFVTTSEPYGYITAKIVRQKG